MKQLNDKQENKREIILPTGKKVLFQLHHSSKNGFDKYTELVNNSAGYTVIKAYMMPSKAEADFKSLDSKGAYTLFPRNEAEEKKVRFMPIKECPGEFIMTLCLN